MGEFHFNTVYIAPMLIGIKGSIIFFFLGLPELTHVCIYSTWPTFLNRRYLLGVNQDNRFLAHSYSKVSLFNISDWQFSRLCIFPRLQFLCVSTCISLTFVLTGDMNPQCTTYLSHRLFLSYYFFFWGFKAHAANAIKIAMQIGVISTFLNNLSKGDHLLSDE